MYILGDNLSSYLSDISTQSVVSRTSLPILCSHIYIFSLSLCLYIVLMSTMGDTCGICVLTDICNKDKIYRNFAN